MDKQGIKICHNNIIDQRQITQHNDKHILYLNDILNNSFFPWTTHFEYLLRVREYTKLNLFVSTKQIKNNHPCTAVYHNNAF